MTAEPPSRSEADFWNWAGDTSRGFGERTMPDLTEASPVGNVFLSKNREGRSFDVSKLSEALKRFVANKSFPVEQLYKDFMVKNYSETTYLKRVPGGENTDAHDAMVCLVDSLSKLPPWK